MNKNWYLVFPTDRKFNSFKVLKMKINIINLNLVKYN